MIFAPQYSVEFYLSLGLGDICQPKIQNWYECRLNFVWTPLFREFYHNAASSGLITYLYLDWYTDYYLLSWVTFLMIFQCTANLVYELWKNPLKWAKFEEYFAIKQQMNIVIFIMSKSCICDNSKIKMSDLLKRCIV